MTAEEVLARAADILEQKGWLQNEWQDAEGRCCILGALARANEGCGTERWYALKAAVAREVGMDDLLTWNNAHGRCAEEVITALRNSKRHLEPGE